MFQPDTDIQRSSTLAAFLKDCGTDSYEDLASRANTDPDWFWGRIIEFAGLRFHRPYTRLRDMSDGPESIRWAVGGAKHHAAHGGAGPARHIDACTVH